MIKSIVLRYERENSWLRFESPLDVMVARSCDEVQPLLREVELMVEKGFYAAGFISYEAAPGFDAALKTKPPAEFPLLCFGLFNAPKQIEPLIAVGTSSSDSGWSNQLNQDEFKDKIARIKNRLRAGHTYQVNFTMQRQKKFCGDPWGLFTGFACDAPYAAFIDLEEYAICSASPELFFDLHEGAIHLRPMKGTAPRGMTLAEDCFHRRSLQTSAKDHAENAMILDMVRNDIGKIADIGSISVEESFKLEKYPTVWQMTSSVSARTNASMCNLMQSLFPCASITGAPKVNTMHIIDSLEDQPREIYTGCIGFFSPKGDAQFNVAIRTALIDKNSQSLNYGIGAGIVWDSIAESEYEECQLKAKVINSPISCSNFSLIETILWRESGGYFLLEYHLRRMKDSAEYFDFRFDEAELQEKLGELEQAMDCSDSKVRILLDRKGELDISASLLPANMLNKSQGARLAKQPVNSNNPYLHHKTTHREMYERAQAEVPECDDVILINERGEVTESTIANVVMRNGSDLITPPVTCGLLAGTFRQYLLDKGEVVEGIISREALIASEEIYLVNSVRQWQRAVLLS